MIKRDLTKLPVFGPEAANCTACELQQQCSRRFTATAYRPSQFNGLMVIGEGPGAQEVAENRPFVGQSGKLLRAMLSQVGINFDQCYVTNATLCRPAPHKKGFVEDFPNAIASCLPRLEAEIAAVGPRVILALGTPALISCTGYDTPKASRQAIDCDQCNENRRVGPVIQCSAPATEGDGACGHLHFLKGESTTHVDANELAKIKAAGCQKCGSRFKNVRPKMVKCPNCGGRKFRVVDGFEFTWDFNVGEVAGAIFTPVAVDKTREPNNLGRWFAEQGVQYLVPSYHPAFLLRDQQFMAEAVLKHFAKVKRLLDGVKPHWALNYRKTNDPAEARRFLYAWKAQGKPAPEFDVDIETEPKIGADDKPLDARYPPDVEKVKVIGIGTEDETLVIDTRECNPGDPADPLLSVIAEFLCDEEIPKCYHNGACYDIPVLDIVWGIPAAQQIKSYNNDTLGLHTILWPDEPHKLSHVAFSYTNSPAWKPPRTAHGVEVHKDFEDLALYNARDVRNTSESRVRMRRELKPNKLEKVDEIDRQVRRIAVEMTMAGLPIDLDARQVQEDKARALEKQALRDTLAPLEELKLIPVVDPQDTSAEAKAARFNPFSHPALAKMLFSKDGLGLKPLSFTKEGAPQTDEPTIHGLLASTQDPSVRTFLSSLLRLREHHKTVANYFDSHEAQPWKLDGRIHSFWQPWGAKTGRFSSKKINEQNIPKWMRAMFIAPKGRVIVGADEDQLELRNLAALSGDPVLIHKCMTADEKRKLEPDHDPHSFVAQAAFATTYTNLLLKDPACIVKQDAQCKCQTCTRKALRDLIKRVIYGLNYGSGDRTVLEAIYSKGDYTGPPIDLRMIGHVRKTVFSAFAEVPPWREAILVEARSTRELRSPLHGRRRVFPLGEVPATEAWNYPIQSLAADLVNEMLIELRQRLPAVDPSAFIMAQVHDAIYIEADENKGEAVSKLMGEVMTREIVLRNGAPPMLFTASGQVAKDWRSAA